MQQVPAVFADDIAEVEADPIIGRSPAMQEVYKAVGRVGRLTFSGILAWWMARTYHLSQIPGAIRKLRAVS
jgi:hypothetical protein